MDEEKEPEQQPLKLNWFQRRAIKKLMKKGNKIVQRMQEKVQTEVKHRKLLEKHILELDEYFEMETDEGTPITKDNITEIHNDELIDVLEKSFQSLEKLVEKVE